MNNLSLRIRLAFTFVLFTLFISAVLGIQSTNTTRRNLLEQEYGDLQETARAAANELDLVLDNQLDAIRTEAQIRDIVEYLLLPASRRPGSVEEERALRTLINLTRKDPVYISSYSIMDANGVDVLDTFSDDIGVDKAGRDYFVAPFNSGLPYISPIRVSQTTFEPSIYFAAPIRSSDGEIIGVLRTRYNATFIQNILVSASTASTFSDHVEEYSVLVDNETFIRLAHTGDPTLSFKAYGELNEEQVAQLQEDLRLLPGSVSDVVVSVPEIVDGIINFENEPVFTAPSIYDGAPAYTVGSQLQNANWTVLVQHTERAALAPVQAQTRSILLSTLVILAVAAGLGVFVALLFARPLGQLADAANKIAAGNFDERVEITSGDEIGTLANSFNYMAEQVKESITLLDQRVQERTRALEVSAEISRRLTAILDPNELAQEVVNEVQSSFNYYYAQVYLFDDAGENLVLTAGTGEAGAEMMKRGHKLPKGQGLVGRAAETKESILVADTSQDPDWLPNKLLPNTQAEAAVPIIVGERVLGVLDVQDDVKEDITDSDIALLESLASQVAVALQNAASYDRAETALQEAKSLVDSAPEAIAIVDLTTGFFVDPNKNAEKLYGLSYDELIKVGPAQMSPPTQPDGRDSTEAAMEKINEAMEGGTPVFEWTHRNGQGKDVLCEIHLVRLPGAAPRVRATVIDITERKELERLTAQRARQQEAINTITQKIQAATTIEESLQVAARELGHALGQKQTVVALEPSALSDNGKE